MIARTAAPFLQDGQTVVLNPGRTFGVLEFDAALRRSGCDAQIRLAEADTFLFTCRCSRIGRPVIYRIKDELKIAALHPEDTPAVVGQLRELFPCVQPAQSILETGLSNMGILFHPVPALMNLVRIEAGEDFLYYHEGISPLVASVLERLNQERVAVARALGVPVLPVLDWLHSKYGSRGGSLYEALQQTEAYAAVLGPKDIHTRYLYEDVPTGCVPLLALGRLLGLRMPVTQSVVQWASTVCGTDFYAIGRNEKRLDLSSLLPNPPPPHGSVRLVRIDFSRQRTAGNASALSAVRFCISSSGHCRCAAYCSSCWAQSSERPTALCHSRIRRSRSGCVIFGI